MSSGAFVKPQSEYRHPARRGYVIINNWGIVRHIPLWWHYKNIFRLRSIFRNYNEFVRHMNESDQPGSKQFIRSMAKGPVRTIPRDHDAMKEELGY